MQDFDQVYAQYFPQVYQFALSLCRDPVLAEELTQETFFKALKSIDQFQQQCRLSTWLCQIAKNTWLSGAKKQARQTGQLPEELAAPEDIEHSFICRESALEIHKALHGLQEPYKEVFSLRVFGELSFAQIGLLFDKTESWARVTFYRAKLKIREELK